MKIVMDDGTEIAVGSEWVSRNVVENWRWRITGFSVSVIATDTPQMVSKENPIRFIRNYRLVPPTPTTLDDPRGLAEAIWMNMPSATVTQNSVDAIELAIKATMSKGPVR